MADSSVLAQLCQLSHASSLQQICDMAYDILGNPIFIKDMGHTTLAYTKTVDIDDEQWRSAVVESRIDRAVLRQDRVVSTIHESTIAAQMPVVVEDGDFSQARIIRALSSGGQPVGVLVLTAYLHPIGPDDLELVELISGFVIPQLLREHYYTAAGDSAVENYFMKLLDGAKESNEQVKKRLDSLGYALQPSTYVMTVCPEEETLPEEKGDLQILLRELRQLQHCRAFLYNSALVCVYGSDRDVSDWEQDAPELTEILTRWGMAAAVSRRLDAMEHLRQFHLQTQEMMAVALPLKRNFRYYAYDSMSSYLLFRRLPRGELSLYCHQKIMELGEYDRLHNTELCITLQVYLEHTKSLAKTADILFIHRNTVRYRINKCMELLGSELNDGNEIFAFILSLRLLEYELKIPE